MEKKSIIIIVLVAVILFLIVYITAIKFNQAQQEKVNIAFQQGLQQGQVLEQRTALTQIQSTGIYTIQVLDETNQTQLVRLGVIQPNLPSTEQFQTEQ